MKSFLNYVMYSVAIVVVLSMPLSVYAQSVNCNSLVAMDEANVLSNTAVLEKSAAGLIDQGADVHVVSTNTAPLIRVEVNLEAQCPNWLANGHRKPNLFVVMVAPKLRLKNVFFGGAYTAALPHQDDVHLIYSQAANPYFRQDDFSRGIAAALKDFSAKVSAYHDQEKHPVQQSTTVNNQAEDYSGLYTFLDWMLVIIVFVLAFWGTTAWLVSRRKRREAIITAQTDAKSSKNLATSAYQQLPSDSPKYDLLSKRFMELSNSVKNDPDTDGLTAQEYKSIQSSWSSLYYDCLGKPTSSSNPENYRPKRKHSHTTSSQTSSYTPQASYNPYPSQQTVVVHDNSGSDMLTGMIIGEELSQPRERDVYVHDTPNYSAPEPRYESSSSSGSDSSWSSSSSDSSSDYSSSSGSDSSYSDSSSSSDFGGGGSDSSW